MWEGHSSALIALLTVDLSYLEAPLDLKCWPNKFIGDRFSRFRRQAAGLVQDQIWLDCQNENSRLFHVDFSIKLHFCFHFLVVLIRYVPVLVFPKCFGLLHISYLNRVHIQILY